MEILIKNLHFDKFKGEPWQFKIDRTTPVGNPFPVHISGREGSCTKYAEYALCIFGNSKPNILFSGYIEEMANAYKKYGRLELFCWCYSGEWRMAKNICHAFTIAQFIDSLVNGVKIIIAGSREFNDYKKLEETMDEIALKNTMFPNLVVICGGARGADALGKKWAENRGFPVIIKPANWSLGKHAGLLRNEEMAKIADACICFWDGKSTGTMNMIKLAKEYDLLLRVVEYDSEGIYYE